jgi:hypothetical protein
MELSLDVLWYTDEQQKLIDAGLDKDFDLDDCIFKEHTFYSINVIREYEKGYTTIFAGDDSFVVKKSYEEVKELIRNQMAYRYN